MMRTVSLQRRTPAASRRSPPTATTATARRGARRQVALLPLRPQLRVGGRQPVGIAAARAVLRQADRRSTMVSMKPGERSPFQPDDELSPPAKDDKPTRRRQERREEGRQEGRTKPPAPAPSRARASSRRRRRRRPRRASTTRLLEVPLPRRQLRRPARPTASGSTSCRSDVVVHRHGRRSRRWRSRTRSPKPETFFDEVGGYELSLDRKKLMVRKAQDIFVFDAGAKAPSRHLARARCRSATGRSGSIRATSGARCSPRRGGSSATTSTTAACTASTGRRCRRSTCRWSIASPIARSCRDMLSQMVGELSALHIFVRGGDARRGADQVQPASLGATFARDEKAGGFRVEHIYQTRSRRARTSSRRSPGRTWTCRKATSSSGQRRAGAVGARPRLTAAQPGRQAGAAAGRSRKAAARRATSS